MKALPIFKTAVSQFFDHQVLRLSAALAFYSVFSIGPLLIIAISLSGMVFGPEAVRGQLEYQLNDWMGERSAEVVQDLIASATRSSDSLIMSFVGFGTMILGATGVFGQLKDSLNSIWEVEQPAGKALLKILKTRLFSFSLVLGIGFLLLVSMVLTTALEVVSGAIESAFPLAPFIWQSLNFAISFFVVTILFAMIFRILPDVKLRWSDVWVGAGFTSLLFSIGKFGIGYYLAREATASPYGAAGAFVLVLMWVYFSSVMLLFGAEFTRAWARTRGHQIIPIRGASRITR